MDAAVAIVEAPDLVLRFERVRGQFEVSISAPGPQRRWDGLDSALLWLDMQQGGKISPKFPNWDYGFNPNPDWWSIDQFLSENWDLLRAAASTRPYLKHG